jgi:D-aminoacyl-tRNA deacylase
MKLVIQRVKEASVTVDSRTVGKIKQGVVVLLAVAKNDTPADADYLAEKLINLRLFPDNDDKMNLSLSDIKGEVLVVSQFTLLADCVKGRRPSFDRAAPPQLAERLYSYFVEKLKKSSLKIETGEFRAMMDVALVNDGPVTFILDSKIDNA